MIQELYVKKKDVKIFACNNKFLFLKWEWKFETPSKKKKNPPMLNFKTIT